MSSTSNVFGSTATITEGGSFIPLAEPSMMAMVP